MDAGAVAVGVIELAHAVGPSNITANILYDRRAGCDYQSQRCIAGHFAEFHTGQTANNAAGVQQNFIAVVALALGRNGDGYTGSESL